MKKRIFIICGLIIAVAVIAVCITATLPKDSPKDPVEPASDSSAEVSVQDIRPVIPDGTDPGTEKADGEHQSPSDDTGAAETSAVVTEEDKNVVAPAEPELTDKAPEVVETVVEEDKKAEEIPAPETGMTENGAKEKTEEPGTDIGGDAINDLTEEKKLEAEKQNEEKADEEHPAVVVDEKTVTEETTKPEVIAGTDVPDDGKTEDTKTSGAEYVPQSGDHPFVPPVDGGGGQTYNVDDIVGEGEDRPGEGIHF